MNTTTPPPQPGKFHRKVGRKLAAKEAHRRIAAYRKDEESRGHKRGDYTESEFFGLDFIQDFISRNPDCVGLRFYYGIDANDPDGACRRLTLVAVDEKGKDLWAGGDLRGLKDPGDEELGGDGINCPKHCSTAG